MCDGCHQRGCVCVYWCCGYHDCVCVQVHDPPVQRVLSIECAAAHADVVVAQPVVALQLTPEDAVRQYYQHMLQLHGREAMSMLQEAARYLIGIVR